MKWHPPFSAALASHASGSAAPAAAPARSAVVRLLRGDEGQQRCLRLSLALIALITTSMERATATDWPTYRFDNRRSGVTPESIQVPLTSDWTHISVTPPQTAWTGPAKWDSYANIRRLESMRNFDPAFFVIAVNDLVYFGSSVDDAVHCLDAKTGREKWVFHTDGPVRLPPSWHKGKVYFGSDDGHAYCLDAAQGALVWRRKPADKETLLLNNGKLISHWPCRTGVLVQDDIAYFGASLLPWENSYLCAVDAQTGDDEGPGRYRITLEHLTMQGAMLATQTHLYLPQGRQRPEMFERRTGRSIGGFGSSGQGGIFAVVTRTDEFVHGRGQNHGSDGELRGFDADSRDYFVTFPKATRIVLTEEVAYLNTGAELVGFARARYLELAKRKTQLQAQQKTIQEQLKKLRNQENGLAGKKLIEERTLIESELATLPPKMAACYLWKTDADCPHDLILAGETLFAGGDDRVAAFDTTTGKMRWSAPVTGRAHGLAVANGRLFVSTDRGTIHCFQSAAGG
jgi:outer membrane protein assembly factor BamB